MLLSPFFECRRAEHQKITPVASFSILVPQQSHCFGLAFLVNFVEAKSDIEITNMHIRSMRGSSFFQTWSHTKNQSSSASGFSR
jgi:hypothetical protein